MSNLKAEFHERLTRPGVTLNMPKYYEEKSINCLLESDLKMNKFHADVVRFDEKESYLSTSINLYERKEQFFFFMNETAIELTGQTMPLLYNIVI